LNAVVTMGRWRTETGQSRATNLIAIVKRRGNAFSRRDELSSKRTILCTMENRKRVKIAIWWEPILLRPEIFFAQPLSLK
jgi:hypothetical protein